MTAKTKMLLIDPTDAWVTNAKVLKHHDQVMLPIGLMYLSAYLKHKLGERLHIKIISTIVDLDGPEELVKLLKDFQPDIVGIRCVIFYSEQIIEIAARVRRHLPEVVLMGGGPNVTFDNEQIQANSDFHVLVEGEGEEILHQLVDRYLHLGKSGMLQSLPEINGIIFQKDGKVIKNKPTPDIQNLDCLPFPDYEAVDLTKYGTFLNYGYNRRPMGILFTSRGCPFRCTYCHMVFGKGFRPRSAENVYQEVVYLHDKYGLKDFSIVDDNFTVHRHRVETFCELMKNGPKVNFYFPNGIRADSLDKPLLEKMRDAGAIYITFSLETASSRLQKFIKKRADIEKLRSIVQHSCDLNIITNLCMMVGFPTETLAEAKHSLTYYQQFNKLVIPYYFSVKYYPGTELYNTAQDFDIDIIESSYKTPYHGYEFQETPDISHRDFERLNQWYLRKIFLNPDRIRHAVRVLRHHFSEDEVNDMFTLFFRREVKNVERDILETVAIPN